MLKIANIVDFDRIYSLLRSSFPDDEYRPYAAQKALFSLPEYTAYVTEDVSAVITLWRFEGFFFIEHFAVAPDRRNQGLGAKLLQEVIASLDRPVCLEAELPETDLAVRRLAFYQRNGFHVNPYPYIQPPYAAERNPVPLLLLTTPDKISEAEFQAIRDTLYQKVYNVC